MEMDWGLTRPETQAQKGVEFELNWKPKAQSFIKTAWE